MGRVSHGLNATCAALFAAALVLLSPAASAESIRTLAAGKPAAGGERRIALVIGNGAYKSAPLRNPVNDARAVARVLSETGFSVTLVEDASRSAMRRAVREFGDEIARGGVGLFFFAGHGMQIRGRNYLVPVNADIQREFEVEDEAVDANTVLASMDSAKNALNIMILDACRNNPFQRAFRSAQQGLAQMDAPSGTLVAFATAPGSVAADGDGVNGVYTKHLLAFLRAPGLPVEQLFKQVRIGVAKETAERQIPWESSSLRGDFYFLPPAPGAGAVTQAAMDKALSDVQKQADERLARERAELQKKMEQMIQDALERQRTALEAERRKDGGPPAPSTPLAVAREPAPEVRPNSAAQVSRVSPQPLQPAVPPGEGVAQAGDRWVYHGFETGRRDRRFEAVFEVLGAAESGVIEAAHLGGQQTQWVYTPEPMVVSFGTGFAAFSPHLPGTKSLSVGQSWSSLRNERFAMCRGGAECVASGKVLGSEKVTVRAGTFDAHRIEVVVDARVNHWNAVTYQMTFWYAEKARRMVKYTMRSFLRSGGGSSIPDPDVDYELVAYQLGNEEPVGEREALSRIATRGSTLPGGARQ